MPSMGYLGRIWGRLTDPPASVQDPERRRQSRLLSSLLVPLIPVVALAVIVPTLLDSAHNPSLSSDSYVALIADGLIIIAYGLNRAAHYTVSATIAVGVTAIASFVIAIPDRGPTDVGLLAYLSVSVLMSSMLFSRRGTLILIAASLIGIAIFPALIPQAQYAAALNPLILVVLTSLLLVVATRHRDVLERDRQSELAASEARYRSLFDGVPVGIYRNISGGQITDANFAMAQLLGYPDRESLLAVNVAELYVNQEERVRWRDLARLEGVARDFEARLRRRDGTPFWAQISGRAVRDAAGHVLYYEGALQDITDRKWAEDALRESERRFREILETVKLVAVMLDVQGRVTFCNDFLLELTGRQRDESLGQSWFDNFLPAETRGGVKAMFFGKILSGDIPPQFENEILARGGERRLIAWNNTLLRDLQGHIIGSTSLGEDITDRKQAERLQAAIYRISEAVHSAQNLGALFRSIHMIISDLMPASNFYIALYDAAADIVSFPYFVDEHDEPSPPGKPGQGLTEYVLRTGKPLLAAPEVFEDLVERGEAELVGAPSIDWLGVPLITKDRPVGVLVVQTYTDGVRFSEADKDILVFVSAQVAMAIERKQAEEAVTWLASFPKLNPNPVVEVDVAGRIHYLNPAARQLFSDLSTTGSQHPWLADLESAADRFQQDGAKSIVREVMIGGACYQQTLHYVAENQRVRVYGIDITERKRAEEALRRAQKMESLGILAGGVAHDFNNLLVALLGQISLAQSKLPPDTPARSHIEKAMKAAERASDLTRQMLAYSGHGQFQIRAIDLNVLIQDNLHLFEVAVPKHVHLRSELTEPLPIVEADPGQMQQVIMNLILNAAEAIGDRPGTVSVITGTQTVSAGEAEAGYTAGDPLAPGDFVTLEVRDDGSGMDTATLSKIFDPFFTTKFTGRGLGLSAVLGIVRGHKGGLWVNSEIGSGTSFKLLFPVAGDAAPAASAAPAATHAVGAHSGLILVIDDEEAVRDAVTDILELENIQAICVPDGNTGIAVYRERAAEIVLVLLDLSMPGLSGEQTFRELRKIDPNVRVILSSGYDQVEVTRRFTDQGLTGFVQKPYDAETLIREIRYHLE